MITLLCHLFAVKIKIFRVKLYIYEIKLLFLHRFRCTSPLCPSASEHDVTVTFWRIGKDQPIKEGALGGENVENSGENTQSVATYRGT